MTRTYPVDSRRGQHTEVQVTDEAGGPLPYAVGLFPIGTSTGICIGVGATLMGALNDALDTLQMGRWALHDAILVDAKNRGGVSAAGGGASTNRGGHSAGGADDADGA